MTEKNKGKKLKMTGSRRDAFEYRNKYHKYKYTAEWTWHTDMHIDGRRHHANSDRDVTISILVKTIK